MQNFLDVWHEWLSGKPSAEEIQAAAVRNFVLALSKLCDGEILLTTQVSVACPEGISEEHKCLVHGLLKSLEEIALFEMAENLLREEDESDIKKCGKTVDTIPSCCPSPQAKSNCPYFNIGPAHFVTLLLLAWPHKRCDNTNGLLLRRLAMNQMSRSTLSLQNEVSQLGRQLESISTYITMCNNKSSCKCR